MEIDILERCRARDRKAFRGLVALWGDQALKVASAVTEDRARAESAVRDGFLSCWREMSSLHSETAFRPWLMRAVVRGALGGTVPSESLAPIVEQKSARKADDTIRTIVAQAPATMQLRQNFFEDDVLPHLDEPFTLELRRVMSAPPETVWGALTEPSMPWTETLGARVRPLGPLRRGSRIVASGHVAGRRRSRDESIVTRAEEPKMLAWMTRAKLFPLPGAIEFRWTLALARAEGGSEIRHRLLGIAFPSGASGRALARAYEKIASGMQSSMHRGIEKLAVLAEARAPAE